jgi:ABC-type bacteriocin/lantibiotic exporter with double-glycine peptidase domain
MKLFIIFFAIIAVIVLIVGFVFPIIDICINDMVRKHRKNKG